MLHSNKLFALFHTKIVTSLKKKNKNGQNEKCQEEFQLDCMFDLNNFTNQFNKMNF